MSDKVGTPRHAFIAGPVDGKDRTVCADCGQLWEVRVHEYGTPDHPLKYRTPNDGSRA